MQGHYFEAQSEDSVSNVLHFVQDKALLLAKTCYMTSSIQTEFLFSVWCNYSSLKFFMTLAPDMAFEINRENLSILVNKYICNKDM